MPLETKSCQVTCPECGVAFLVEVARSVDHLRVECQHCSERMLLPNTAFRPDERSA